MKNRWAFGPERVRSQTISFEYWVLSFEYRVLSLECFRIFRIYLMTFWRPPRDPPGPKLQGSLSGLGPWVVSLLFSKISNGKWPKLSPGGAVIAALGRHSCPNLNVYLSCCACFFSILLFLKLHFQTNHDWHLAKCALRGLLDNDPGAPFWLKS